MRAETLAAIEQEAADRATAHAASADRSRDRIAKMETALLAALYIISDGAHGKDPTPDGRLDGARAFEIICEALKD